MNLFRCNNFVLRNVNDKTVMKIAEKYLSKSELQDRVQFSVLYQKGHQIEMQNTEEPCLSELLRRHVRGSDT